MTAHASSTTVPPDAELAARASEYLHQLCIAIPSRSVGSAGNRQATEFFARTMASFGLQSEQVWFDCLDWTSGGAQLHVGGAAIAASVSPYSLGCQVHAPLSVASTLEELSAAQVTGSVLLICGPLATEPLMPKNFTFYNPEHHQRIIALLEAAQPAAIIAATGQHPELAGALSPFPLLEDGDFDIPSVYLPEAVGATLQQAAGSTVELTINARRTPAQAANVIAGTGHPAQERIVLFAHIDAKPGTPGALDNAAGVTTLLLLAELCRGYQGRFTLEFVTMNGEDYYCAPGEQAYLNANTGHFGTIALGMNIDGIGLQQSRSAYSLYHCPAALDAHIRQTFAAFPDLVEGPAWYQGDHVLFLLHERPTLALTSEDLTTLTTTITHTPDDRPELVNTLRLARTARALHTLIAAR